MASVYNLCSLEHCYTNLFALTDLKGIKWSKLRLKDQYTEMNGYLDDPILQVYSKCLNEDLLCAWKRINKTNLKELWLFWYDKEPANMRAHIAAAELVEYDCGSWEKQEANGLSYECRIVLFKALHNRIEKCLVNKDFARLGKWFVQPYKHFICNNLIDSNTSGLNHVSYAFNFFLHGTSKICTSVDVKVHKPIRSINKYDLVDLNANGGSSYGPKLNVILSPFGLNGLLVGYLNNDNETSKRNYDEWKRFYSIKNTDDVHLPRMLIIVVDDLSAFRPHQHHLDPNIKILFLHYSKNKGNDLRLFYPTSYVYVQMNDEVLNPRLDDKTFKKYNEDNNKENNHDDDNNSFKQKANKKPSHKLTSNGNKHTNESMLNAAKQLDSLDLTIDSVARNGPATPPTSILSPNNVNILHKSPLIANPVDFRQKGPMSKSMKHIKNPFKYWKRQYKHLLTTDAILNRILLANTMTDVNRCVPMAKMITNDTAIQQINLKHQNVELIQENVQLAYKVINKCSCFVLNSLCFGVTPGSRSQAACTCESKQLKRFDRQKSSPPLSQQVAKVNFKLFHRRSVLDDTAGVGDDHVAKQQRLDMSVISDGDDVLNGFQSGFDINNELSSSIDETNLIDDDDDDDGDDDDGDDDDSEDDDDDDDSEDDELALNMLNNSHENSFFSTNKIDLEADIDLDIEVAAKVTSRPVVNNATTDDDDEDDENDTDDDSDENEDSDRDANKKAKIVINTIDNNNNMKVGAANCQTKKDAMGNTFFSLLTNSNRLKVQQNQRQRSVHRFASGAIVGDSLKRPILKDTDNDNDEILRYDLLYAQNLLPVHSNPSQSTNSLKRPRNDSDYNSPSNAVELLLYDMQPLMTQDTAVTTTTTTTNTVHPQMTPPQSVENPGSVDNTMSKQGQKGVQKTMPSFTINPSNTFKPSYDDLNNIFEEELDDQHQQQQHQHHQQQTNNNTDPLNIHRNHLIDCNMIVMTPPSHENPTELAISQRTSPLVISSMHSGTITSTTSLDVDQTSPPLPNNRTECQVFDVTTSALVDTCQVQAQVATSDHPKPSSKLLFFEPFVLSQLPFVNNYYQASKTYSKLDIISTCNKIDYPKWSSIRKMAPSSHQIVVQKPSFKTMATHLTPGGTYSSHIRAQHTPKGQQQHQQQQYLVRYQQQQQQQQQLYPVQQQQMQQRFQSTVQRSNSQSYRGMNGAPMTDFNMNSDYAACASPLATSVHSPYYQPKTPSNQATAVAIARRNSLNRTTPIPSPYAAAQQSYNQLPNTSVMSVGNTSASEQQPLSVLSSYGGAGGGADSPMSQHSTLNTSGMAYANQQQRLNTSFYDTQVPTPQSGPNSVQYMPPTPTYNSQYNQQQTSQQQQQMQKYPYLISNLQTTNTNKMPVYPQQPYPQQQQQQQQHYPQQYQQQQQPYQIQTTQFYNDQNYQQQSYKQQQQQPQQASSVCTTTSTTATAPTATASTSSSFVDQDVNSLILNLHLSDSLLNIYRDINFDSCTLCVCSNNNIKGMDYQIYIVNDGLLRPMLGHNKNKQQSLTTASMSQMLTATGDHNHPDYNFQMNQCTCGFSSVVNRRLAYNAGLFYEDFVDIIGVKLVSKYNNTVTLTATGKYVDAPVGANKSPTILQSPVGQLNNGLMQLFEMKYSCPLMNLYDCNDIYGSRRPMLCKAAVDDLNYTIDENNVCLNAIEYLMQGDNDQDHKALVSHGATYDYLDFNWLNTKKELKSNNELTKCLKYMQPLLDEAIQRKHTSACLWETVQGPMTWQHFCRIAYRDVNSGILTCNYEPEPIPALLVSSSEHDWLSVSPYAIKFWDKLCIEPYSKQKNIAYCIMCPDSETILTSVRKYLKEFNSVYELCRLGYHRPALRISHDNGIMKVPFGNKDVHDVDADIELWFKQFKNQMLVNKLKAYFATFKRLAKIVKQCNIDSNLYDEQRKTEVVHPATQQSSNNNNNSQQQQPQQYHQQQQQQQNNVDYQDMSPLHNDLMDNSLSTTNQMTSLFGNNDDFNHYAAFDNPDGTNSGPAPQALSYMSHSTSQMNSSSRHMTPSGTISSQYSQMNSAQAQSTATSQQPAPIKPISQSTYNLNLIVYIVDPFECTSDTTEDHTKLKRLIDLTLFNSYLDFLNSLSNETTKQRITFQILPLNIIMDMYVNNDDDLKLNMHRSQAFNVFSSIKRYYMPHMPRSKNLTGFGPAAFDEKYLKDNFNQNLRMQFYSPPFILAPNHTSLYKAGVGGKGGVVGTDTTGGLLQTGSGGKSATTKPTAANASGQQSIGPMGSGAGGAHDLMKNFNKLSGTSIGSNLLMQQFLQLNYSYYDQSNVLYVGYCLSDDQRYLLASCCDENGELVESTSINIQVAERHRRRAQHARRIGLRKLWEFIMRVVAQTCKPWRLVIGRLGRLGHSELAGWGCLLSKKNLQRVCQQLKDTCESCNVIGNTEMPCILSACLISMEKCSSICIYPESFSREDKNAAGLSQQANQHLQGVSCTHILTFPASAIIQTSVTANTKEDQNKDDFFDFFKFDDGENDLDLFVEESHNKGFNDSALIDSDSNNLKEKILNQEETPHLDQQPLAVGYYVSTAKCGPLPDWLLGDSSNDTNFHTFKATLHIHNPYALENDDLIMQMKNEHKLDSFVTYEVLRYVLERYNALSWLNIDPVTQDRRSCLPLHHTILLQMYHAFANYI